MDTGNDVSAWTSAEVERYLITIGLGGKVSDTFVRHHIDGTSLIALRRNDLDEMDLAAEADEVLIKILALQGVRTRTPPRGEAYVQIEASDEISVSTTTNLIAPTNVNDRNFTLSSTEGRTSASANNIPPDYRLLALAAAYAAVALFTMSFALVYVHERVPDPKTNPPLPDIIMSNIKRVPWSYDVAEYTAVVLGAIWIVTLFFHDHRTVLLRRFFVIMGTLYVFRCACVISTSLSISRRNTGCHALVMSTFGGKLVKAMRIFVACGMKVGGVYTCGDYMYSGHTIGLVGLTQFINEYTPPRLLPLHIFTWLASILGMFFIVLAHEHYTVDIVVALILTTKLFQYYHIMANNSQMLRTEPCRLRTWFPLVYIFEANTTFTVPNTFGFPDAFRRFVDYIGRSCFKVRSEERNKDSV